MVETSECGTEAVVKTTCSLCKKENTWHSQPTMPGSGIPAGNFLLCIAILVAGGGALQVKLGLQDTGTRMSRKRTGSKMALGNLTVHDHKLDVPHSCQR